MKKDKNMDDILFGKVYYKLRKGVITKCDSSLYYKLQQWVITNCDRYVITNCDKFYYKLRQVLQIATGQTSVQNFKQVGWLQQLFNPRSLEGGRVKLTPPRLLALNFCSLTDCQKLWHNCFLFVNTSFDTN